MKISKKSVNENEGFRSLFFCKIIFFFYFLVSGNSIPEEAAETEFCAEVSSTTSSTLLLRCQEGEVTSEEREFEDGQKIDGEATGMLVALPRVLSASTATTAEAIEASTKHSKLMI